MFTLKDNEALLAMKEQLQEKKTRLKGIVRTTARGFGFLDLEDDSSAFIPKSLMYGLLPDAQVEALADKGDKGLIVSEVTSIKDRGQTQYFCRTDVFEVDGREYANAIPLRNDVGIKIQLGQRKNVGADDGDIIAVDIYQLPDKGVGKYKGNVTSKLGNEAEPATIWSLIKEEFRLNIPLEEITLSSMPNFDNPDYWMNERGYKDLTHIPLCTIDSYSSRDLDDALYVEDKGDEWELTVAIADPTCIVKGDDALRQLFVSRGVTHYLATEIIHLMAKFFSEDNFSLLEGKIRPSLVATIMVDKTSGKANFKTIEMAIIESKAKLSYDQVSEHIKQRAVSVIDELPEVAKSLNQLYELSLVRRGFREEHQLIGIDESEYFFVIEDNMPVGVKEIVRTVAHSMVEEAAVAANTGFAEWAVENELPVAYVTHQGFSEDKIKNVRDYLSTRGVELSGDEDILELFEIAHSRLYEKLKVSQAQGDEYDIALAKKDLTELRGFYKKGEFSLSPKPHMPMGMSQYATWTSPIRKALDMLNHMVIKSFLAGEDASPVSQQEIDVIQERNRSSRQAERKLNRLLGLTYLKKKTNEPLEASLVQVMKSAVRLEIEGTGIGIVVGFKELGFDGFVKLDSVHQTVIANEEVVMRLSDKCHVSISSVDVYTGEVLARRVLEDENEGQA